jgi:hypothetical protein
MPARQTSFQYGRPPDHANLASFVMGGEAQPMLDNWMSKSRWAAWRLVSRSRPLHDAGLAANHVMAVAAIAGVLSGLAFAHGLNGISVLLVANRFGLSLQ